MQTAPPLEPSLPSEPDLDLLLPVFFVFDPANIETILDTIVYKVGDHYIMAVFYLNELSTDSVEVHIKVTCQIDSLMITEFHSSYF